MRTALVVHAHPDDEVFATGAATAVLSTAGWRVVLRVATRGIGDAADKLQASCDLLGIDDWDWLSTKDRWVDDGGSAGPRTLAATDPQQLADEVERTVHEVQPQLVLTVGRDGLTGHPDHIAISTAVQQQQCYALGAQLRAEDVRAGEELMRRLLPGEKVGSGMVVGSDRTDLLEIGKAPESRRRQALDQYYAGLGTTDIAELLTTYGRRGDSLLLRAIYDVSGWDTDRFEVLSSSGSDVPSFP
ncbi:PIG-L family deacetylase [Kribbella turkmenica]|uniref:PIG-L family deacetylase n=1 Tax=Kribbella turkmenica TaxID=2530375 RepID=A0A4R4WBE9_9ACTN|nr:PIG-L family deacetylase [Kribbella turkmenica]TDD16122.1 PIG-L family deacetylase [Kribbella turkmenica]